MKSIWKRVAENTNRGWSKHGGKNCSNSYDYYWEEEEQEMTVVATGRKTEENTRRAWPKYALTNQQSRGSMSSLNRSSLPSRGFLV